MSTPGIVFADRQRMVVEIDSRARSILGDTAQELVGKPVDDLLGLIAAGNLHDCVVLLVHVSSQQTDARTAEAMNRRVETLEAQVAMLEAQRKSMVSTLAHDIRSPLGVITGAIGELETEPGGVNPEHKMMFGLIRRSADRLTRLATTLLDYLQIQEGRLSIQPAMADLADVVRNGVTDARERTDRRGVRVDCDVPDTLPAVVDAQRVREAMLHLLSAALRQARERVTVNLRASNEEATIEVTDDRPEVEREDVTHAFDAFVAERKGKGTFELAIARGFVEAHGGRARAEAVNASFKGGVRFIVTLPNKKKSAN